MIYIASPYTNKRGDVMEARFIVNEACTAFWMSQGNPVFSPIVHCRQIALKYEFPHDFDYWQRMNFAWIDASEMVWVLQFPNWHVSKGVCGEIKHAEYTGKNVLFYSWEEIQSICLAPMKTDEIINSIEIIKEYA